MKGKRAISIAAITGFGLLVALVCYAAYNHNGDIDSVNFRTVYPDKVGTKLDSCNACHKGGTDPKNSKTTLGSCQYCHAVSDYGKTAGYDYSLTLNPYGLAYLNAGRNADAIKAIEALDSDGDGYSNKAEIAAGRYPGDSKDDPTKVTAPSKVYTRDELEKMLNHTHPKMRGCDHHKKMQPHTQFLLMNASKSDDYYAEYWGVSMENLVKPLALPSAAGVTVVSPDGFSQYHPFQPASGSYHAFGTYPAGTFFYNDVADLAVNKTSGWCNYSAPSAQGRQNGDAIVNPDGLRMLLAIKRDGEHLTPGVLNQSNKLDGEGPFRVIPPQLVPGYPDQRSTVSNWTGTWPYSSANDHNAGFSTRSTTIIRVDPLPTGTTDIDLLEAAWPYIDQNKIVLYGAINPHETIETKLDELDAAIDSISRKSFKTPAGKADLERKVWMVRWLVELGKRDMAYQILKKDLMGKMDGCINSTSPDKNDWLKDCETQTKLYWAVNEIMVLLTIPLT